MVEHAGPVQVQDGALDRPLDPEAGNCRPGCAGRRRGGDRESRCSRSAFRVARGCTQQRARSTRIAGKPQKLREFATRVPASATPSGTHDRWDASSGPRHGRCHGVRRERRRKPGVACPRRPPEAETTRRRPGAGVGPEKVQCIIELVHMNLGADGADSHGVQAAPEPVRS